MPIALCKNCRRPYGDCNGRCVDTNGVPHVSVTSATSARDQRRDRLRSEIGEAHSLVGLVHSLESVTRAARKFSELFPEGDTVALLRRDCVHVEEYVAEMRAIPFSPGTSHVREAPEVCDCEDWKPGTDKINGVVFTAYARHPGVDFKFIPWKFCPWCGKTSRRDDTDHNPRDV